MPGWDEAPNEWRYRIKEPSAFDKDSFRSVDIDPGVRLIIGKPIGKAGPDDPTQEQALRFSKEIFPQISQAQAWFNEHWKKEENKQKIMSYVKDVYKRREYK